MISRLLILICITIGISDLFAQPKPLRILFENEPTVKNYPPVGGAQVRNYDFMIKRAFPDAEVDMQKYISALDEARSVLVYRRRGQAQQSTTHWQSLGPKWIGGRISALAMHPTAPKTFYAGAAAGGVWKTTDGGNSWRPLTDTFKTLPVGCITIDPHDPETIYLGQGEANNSADSYPGLGVWRSTNGGDSWQSLGLEKTQYIVKIIVDPTDRNTIYVAVPGPRTAADSNRGVYKSTDFGATWKNVLLVRMGTTRTSQPAQVCDLAINPADRNELVAAIYDTRGTSTTGSPYTGLWHTTNAGDSWQRIDTGKVTYPDGAAEKRLARGSLYWANTEGKSTLYSLVTKTDVSILTGFRTDENLYALYKTNNPAGDEWKLCIDSTFRIAYLGNYVDSVDIFYRQGGYNNFLAGHPKRPNEVYIGGIDVLRSTDNGTTFTNITRSYPHYFANDRSQHSDQHAFGVSADPSGDELYVGSDGGVFHTMTYGDSWRQLRGIPMTMFYHVEPWRAVMKDYPDNFGLDSIKLIGGTQDNGTVAAGFTSDSDWRWVNRGDGGWAQTHPTDKEKIITSLQLGKVFVKNSLDSLRPNLATDEGSDDNTYRWYQITRLLTHGPTALTDTAEPCSFIPDIVLDPENPDELYTIRTKVYRAKINWADPMKTQWSVWSPQMGGYLRNPKQWYYGTLDAIALGVRDANGRPMLWAGGYMVDSSLGGGDVSRASMWRTVVDESLGPNDPPRWMKITTGLPAATVATIIPDRSDSLSAIIGFSSYNTNRIYKTVDGGKRWIAMTGDLPVAPVNELVIDTAAERGNPAAKNQCIYAATDVGVFVTTNGGKNWNRLGENFPPVVAEHIVKYKNYLLAATHALGIFAIDVSNITAEPLLSVQPERRERIIAGIVRPNPVRSGTTMIQVLVQNPSAGKDEVTVEIISAATGISVRHERKIITSTEEMLEVNVSGLSSGSYLLVVRDKQGDIASQKFSLVE